LAIRPRKLPFLLALLLLGVAVFGASLRGLAQPAEDIWAPAVNLSHSGAASSPALVVKPDGTLRVFWWDQFDGLMVADGFVPTATGQEGALIEGTAQVTETVRTASTWSGPKSAPLKVMPQIVGDPSGQAHAIWLGEPDQQTGDRPLLHSRLAADSSSWSAPATIDSTAAGFDVTTDVTGTLHLIYVRPAETQELPVGLYYRRSTNAGQSWSSETAIYQSRYMRLSRADEDHLRLTAGDAGNLYAVWDDPQLEGMLLSRSTDGGATWEQARPFTTSDAQPQNNCIIGVPGEPMTLLWQSGSGGSSVIAASSAGNALTLAAWDGERWSGSIRLAFDLVDYQSGGQVYLSPSQVELVPSLAGVEGSTQSLIVLGTDQNSDIWITGSTTEKLEQMLTAPASVKEEAGAPTPTNLSHSGAASSPAIVAGPDNTLRALWWDQFDGLMAADGAMIASSTYSGTQEISTVRERWSEPRPLPIAANTTPQIFADAAGGVHALWLNVATGQAIAEQALAIPLMHSRLAADGTAWSSPEVLAESAASFDVTTDASGELHLAYIHTEHTAASPAGVYYRRTADGGATWNAPVALQQSRYVRLLSAETAHLRLAVDGTGGVYVTWDDPRLEQLWLAHSPDGGETWNGPTPISDAEGHLQHGRLIAVPSGATLLMWENADLGTCGLVQAPVTEVLSNGVGAGQRVLEGLTTCPEDERYLPLDAGQALMVAGSGSDSLTLALWDGEQWSEPSRLSFGFEDPELMRQVYLSDLRAALVALPSGATAGLADWGLIAVGTDQEGDVWATSSQMGALEMAFAPPPPWSAPESFFEGAAYSGLPAITSDSEGRLHVLWSEDSGPGEVGAALRYTRWDGKQWTSPTTVLQSTAENLDEPAVIAVGEQLHAVWSSGQSGGISYSRAFVRDAYIAGGWSEPKSLPGPSAAGSQPNIEASTDGHLHAAYAIPLNEGRGIYYTSSGDGGEDWSEARLVFDAATAGWAMVDSPDLAVDVHGLLHIVWIRASLPDHGPPLGVYYARSLDGGETWSEPIEIATGPYAWPQIAVSAPGQVHILWNDATEPHAWWHQASTDGGESWTRPERVPGFGDVPGPVALMDSGNEALHLAGLGQDSSGEAVLIYTVWDGGQWTTPEAFHLDLDSVEPGLSASLLPALGRLDVAFRGAEKTEEGMTQIGLWHSDRLVPTVVVTPAPPLVLHPTATPSPTPEPTATPVPTPNLSGAPPPSTGGSSALPLPLLLAGGLAVLLVAGTFGANLLKVRRSR
jgi:hypothetical protein